MSRNNSLELLYQMNGQFARFATDEALRTDNFDFLNCKDISDLLFTYFAGGHL